MTVLKILRDDRSADFFDAAADGRLLLKCCKACGHISEPRAEMCPRCASTDLGSTDSSGRGTLVAYGIIHSRPTRDQAPTRSAIGIVELDEGPWLHAHIATEDPGVGIGSRVEVAFERADGGEAVPVFKPT